MIAITPIKSLSLQTLLEKKLTPLIQNRFYDFHRKSLINISSMRSPKFMGSEKFANVHPPYGLRY